MKHGTLLLIEYVRPSGLEKALKGDKLLFGSANHAGFKNQFTERRPKPPAAEEVGSSNRVNSIGVLQYRARLRRSTFDAQNFYLSILHKALRYDGSWTDVITVR